MLGEDSVANDPGARRENQSGEADGWRGDTSSWKSQCVDSTQPEGSAEGDQDWWGHGWGTDASGWHLDANSSSSDAWREGWARLAQLITPWLWRAALLHAYRGLKALASMS